jgi:hypothetical protein
MKTDSGVGRHEGRGEPGHGALPRPTTWPVAMAGGITLTGWGLIASPVMLAAGVVLFAVSLGGWIGEIRHERHEG